MIISINASFPIDRIAKAAAGPVWYQLYARRTVDENRELIQAALDAGCKAVVLTVDEPVAGLRERSLHDRNLAQPSRTARAPARRGQESNPNSRYGLSGGQPWMDWKLMDAIRAVTRAPLLAKGVLTGEDARACVEHGLDGVIVSNHGGRAVDYAPSTLEVLPEVVDAAGGHIPVLIDGGFRRGADVLKALALGAKAACLGRTTRWGLAAYGPEGAQKVLQIAQREFTAAMAASGRLSLSAIDRSLVRTDF